LSGTLLFLPRVISVVATTISQGFGTDESFIFVGPTEAAKEVAPDAVDAPKGEDADTGDEVDMNGTPQVSDG